MNYTEDSEPSKMADSHLPAVVANIVIAGFLCYTTTMMNTVTIYALWKTSSLSKPLKTLLLSLAVSDLGAGLLSQPMYIAFLVEKDLRSKNPKTLDDFSTIVSNILFFNFVLQHYSLKYRQIPCHSVASSLPRNCDPQTSSDSCHGNMANHCSLYTDRCPRDKPKISKCLYRNFFHHPFVVLFYFHINFFQDLFNN